MAGATSMRAGSGAWQTAGTCATVTCSHLRSGRHCILHLHANAQTCTVVVLMTG